MKLNILNLRQIKLRYTDDDDFVVQLQNLCHMLIDLKTAVDLHAALTEKRNDLFFSDKGKTLEILDWLINHWEAYAIQRAKEIRSRFLETEDVARTPTGDKRIFS